MKTPTTPSDVAVRELTAKKQALEQHAAEKLARTLRLEATGALPIAPGSVESPAAIKKRWLNGHGDGVVVDSADQELYQLALDRRGIADAIDYIDQRLFDAHACVAREWLVENLKHWHAVQLGRCRALLQLRAANIAAEEFRRKLIALSNVPVGLPADRISGIFSHVRTGDFIGRFLEDCADANIISREEIE